ncbi:MAG TPA: LLM class flavin-dependent oxidoreductase [Jatrophihabitans sp.]|jgi:alkanesulfonate monooxygenase SsuD/methylene tetrahydromethanopterin reductase-like flavin-dependent oxidoreductase (luciferase family)|nr:LLM class flavin-dependent oxidoreductase [Jatrophihabitans sp.]
MVNLGVIFPPDLAPEQLRPVAMAAEESGVGELWLWEDCFAESGIATAAAVLAWTERLRVGIGLLPVPLRNVALTAMELATLARLFPGRLVPGVGHGVLDWMGQVGARVPSPMTLLDEYATALRELLHGQTVSTSGRYVTLDAVGLTWPPRTVPPVLVGGIGPRTLELAGAVGDGVILTGETTLDQVPEAVRHVRAGRSGAGLDTAPEVVVFVTVADRPPAADVAARVGRFVDAGATTVALLSVGDDAPPLAEFARFAGAEVQPLLG